MCDRQAVQHGIKHRTHDGDIIKTPAAFVPIPSCCEVNLRLLKKKEVDHTKEMCSLAVHAILPLSVSLPNKNIVFSAWMHSLPTNCVKEMMNTIPFLLVSWYSSMHGDVVSYRLISYSTASCDWRSLRQLLDKLSEGDIYIESSTCELGVEVSKRPKTTTCCRLIRLAFIAIA